MIVTANDIKTKGITFLDSFLEEAPEVFVSSRGKAKYVIMKVEDYEQKRDEELMAAWKESKKDIENGNYKTQTPAAHFESLGF